MALVRPLQALRPVPEAAHAVAAVPYDVVSTEEARGLAAGNPLSFLHVSRAEIDLAPKADPHGDEVYSRAAVNLARLRRDAPLVVEDAPSLYCYRLQDGDHEQTGLAGCYSLEEYERGVIKRHERTRRDKEDDRTRHMLALRAQTGIVFLTYRASAAVDTVTQRACQQNPLLDMTAADGVRHTVWRLNGTDQMAAVTAFDAVPALYIADGHHRVAGAVRARDELASCGGPTAHQDSQFVLGVAFPDTETRILAYNRTVADLAGYTPKRFLEEMRTRFPVRPDADPAAQKGQVAMYVGGAWYAVDLAGASQPTSETTQADRLDSAVLQKRLLAPVLQVTDTRTDPRMTFVGGARGTDTLEAMVDSGTAAVAFSLAPVTLQELLDVSDAGDIMPPKSTWFEPKLRDGLLIHLI